MKLKFTIILLGLLFSIYQGSGQTTYNKQRLIISKKNSNIIRNIKVDYNITLQNLENPFEGNSHYRHFLQDLKEESARRYPYKPNFNTKRVLENKVDTPAMIYSFEGNKFNNSAPNDNTLAVSKDGIVVSAINTNLIFYDLKNDSLLKTVSLNVFSDTLTTISTHQYDPKVIYDYQQDRFIVVNLSGSSSNSTTHIVVGFQLTDDVMGEWSFYALPGNPLNDTSWTDFPAISLSNDELFITGNLLRYGGSWQTSFKQSVIWQIDKMSGFNGDPTVTVNLFSGIKYNGVNLRNLHPIMGGSGFFGPEMYFMSNKNFAIQSDTFFLLKSTGLISDPNNSLSINLIRADHNYGAPPNPKMPGNKRLATNDARVLGAILENNVLQFVGNTIDTTNGFATVYHGFIKDPDNATTAKLTLIKNDSLQFGYPNISYCGTNSKSLHSILNFNYTSDSINPGLCTMFFEKEGSYSDIKVIKEGEAYISVLFGTLQRWGDYSGSQPVYGDPGKVWLCGTYGKGLNGQRIYGTWISMVQSTTEDAPVFPSPQGKSYVYPNPAIDQVVSVVFDMVVNSDITVEVVDMTGRIIRIMENYPAKQGTNQLSFSTYPLGIGVYVLRILDSNSVIHTHKFVVAN